MPGAATRQLGNFSNVNDNTTVAAGITVPPGTPVFASATGLAAAANAVSLPAVAGATNWLLGFVLTSGAPAATVSGVATVTGLLNAPAGGLQFQFTESASLGGQLQIFLPAALPAQGKNQAITVTIPAITGGAVTAVSVQGFLV